MSVVRTMSSQCFFFKICLNKQNRKAIKRCVMQISKVPNALYLSVEACIYRSRKYCGKKKRCPVKLNDSWKCAKTGERDAMKNRQINSL